MAAIAEYKANLSNILFEGVRHIAAIFGVIDRSSRLSCPIKLRA